jgi:hypothetical protein
VISTSFDTALEGVSGEPCAAADDAELELLESERPGRTAVLKLCGDIVHPDYLRVTAERLNVASLRADHYGIYAELIKCLRHRPFLYIGYGDDDPYLRFLLQALDKTAPDRLLPPRPHFLLAFGSGETGGHAPDRPVSDKVTRVDISGLGQTRREAVSALLELMARHTQDPLAADDGSTAVGIGQVRTAAKDAWVVPVVTTGDVVGERLLARHIRPALARAGRTCVEFATGEDGLTPAQHRRILRLYQSSLCGVFVFGAKSTGLEVVVERVRHFGGRAVILCVRESDLGEYSRSLNHRRMDHKDVAGYLDHELTAAPIEAWIEKAEKGIRRGDATRGVVNCWIGVELCLAYLSARLGKAASPQSRGVNHAFNTARSSGYLLNVSDSEFRALRKVRNALIHSGRSPSRKEAEDTLALARELIRGATFDMQVLIREILTVEAAAHVANDRPRAPFTGAHIAAPKLVPRPSTS